VPFTEFTCRSGGSNLYAGTLDGSAEASTTPLVTYTNGGWNSGTGVFTPASGNPISAGVVVGQFVSIYTDGASAPTGFCSRVTGVSSTTITVHTGQKSGTAPTTAGTGITLVVGGAWLGPNGTSSFPFNFLTSGSTNSSSNAVRVNLKNDATYSVTAALTANQALLTYHGYSTMFGDGGRATIDGGTTGASFVLLNTSVAVVGWGNLIFQNNGSTGSASLFTSNQGRQLIERCLFQGSRGFGIDCSGGAGSVLIDCEITGNNLSNTASTAGARFAGYTVINSNFHDNTGSNTAGAIASAATGSAFIGCVFDTNGAAGFQSAANGTHQFVNCVFYNNAGSGLNISNSNTTTVARNCVFDSNGGHGLNANGFVFNTYSAFRNNTSGPTNVAASSTAYVEEGLITLSASPFTDPANGDFSLNNTAGGGAALRGLGYGTLPTNVGYSGSSVGYPDVGSIQHQDTGGGGGGGLILHRAMDGGYPG
jgi:hypothetical protein